MRLERENAAFFVWEYRKVVPSYRPSTLFWTRVHRTRQRRLPQNIRSVSFLIGNFACLLSEALKYYTIKRFFATINQFWFSSNFDYSVSLACGIVIYFFLQFICFKIVSFSYHRFSYLLIVTVYLFRIYGNSYFLDLRRMWTVLHCVSD